MKARVGRRQAWLLALTESEECQIWPFADNGNGYGYLMSGRKLVSAHRFICEHRRGPPPTPQHEAAHGCGNSLCQNWRHLRWATRTENHADKKLHGTEIFGERNASHKLTPADVRKIRATSGPQRAVGEMFSVSQSVISEIKRGEAWGWLA